MTVTLFLIKGHIQGRWLANNNIWQEEFTKNKTNHNIVVIKILLPVWTICTLKSLNPELSVLIYTLLSLSTIALWIFGVEYLVSGISDAHCELA